MITLEQKYWHLCNQPSDIREHLPILRAFASQCGTIVELGVRCGVSTVALLMGCPGLVFSYDIYRHPFLEVDPSWPRWRFREESSLKVEIPRCELLFIDTIHAKSQLDQELALHAGKVSRWIIFHDTMAFGQTGEDGGPGILEAIREFLAGEPDWSVLLDLRNNHGLMVLQKK